MLLRLEQILADTPSTLYPNPVQDEFLLEEIVLLWIYSMTFKGIKF